MAENFQNTVGSLFKGMEEFITTKTVVGDPVTVGDTIIVPLVDDRLAWELLQRQRRRKTAAEAAWAERFLRARRS